MFGLVLKAVIIEKTLIRGNERIKIILTIITTLCIDDTIDNYKLHFAEQRSLF